jgi:O-succinylbenzoate synthase
VKLLGVELRRVSLPLTNPFRTASGVQSRRDALLLRVETDGAQGWGECAAMRDPLYSSEYVDACAQVLKRYLIPALGHGRHIEARAVASELARFKGHRMAKSAIEMAVLDAELRRQGISFGHRFGAVRERVRCGVSVGVMDSIDQLLDTVDGYLAAGYRRVELKIEPGWDVAPLRAVRERFGDIPLQVDAGAAYRVSDARHLGQLDDYGLLLVEQPLDEEDILGNIRLALHMRTPICLDESITSARVAADAISLGACAIVNIKPGRVGGYLAAQRIHDVCLEHGIPAYCGGMFETGLGRAANVALAALPGFTLPADTPASERYFRTDITEPFVLDAGHLAVPTGAGLGVEPLDDALAAMTTSTEWIPV